MSATTQPRTKAELALIERGQTSVATDAQRRALDVLAAEGLPSRRVEAWHYTDLRVLLGRQAEAGTEGGEPTFLTPFLPHSVVVELGTAGAGNDPARASPSRRAHRLRPSMRWSTISTARSTPCVSSTRRWAPRARASEWRSPRARPA